MLTDHFGNVLVDFGRSVFIHSFDYLYFVNRSSPFTTAYWFLLAFTLPSWGVHH